MPNLRGQIVGVLGDKAPSQLPGDQVGIWMQASDGREVVVTKRMIRQQFLDETGTILQRKVKVRLWLRVQIVTALGPEQIDPAGIDHDFDESDGTPTSLEVSS